MEGTTNNVTIFSRESLLLTFELLRQSNPGLALRVRNVAGGDPLPRDDDEPAEKANDLFEVNLSTADVRRVVEELMCFTNPETVDMENPSINIIARSLMQDWLLLAHQQIAQLPLIHDPDSPILPLG